MSELKVQGMVIAQSVVETIVSMAARDVEGVACVYTPAASNIRSLIGGKPVVPGVLIEVGENDQLNVTLHLEVKSGYVLPDVAANVRQAVADAVAMQVGAQVDSVDIFIDGIQFAN